MKSVEVPSSANLGNPMTILPSAGTATDVWTVTIMSMNVPEFSKVVSRVASDGKLAAGYIVKYVSYLVASDAEVASLKMVSPLPEK